MISPDAMCSAEASAEHTNKQTDDFGKWFSHHHCELFWERPPRVLICIGQGFRYIFVYFYIVIYYVYTVSLCWFSLSLFIIYTGVLIRLKTFVFVVSIERYLIFLLTITMFIGHLKFEHQQYKNADTFLELISNMMPQSIVKVSVDCHTGLSQSCGDALRV